AARVDVDSYSVSSQAMAVASSPEVCVMRLRQASVLGAHPAAPGSVCRRGTACTNAESGRFASWLPHDTVQVTAFLLRIHAENSRIRRLFPTPVGAEMYAAPTFPLNVRVACAWSRSMDSVRPTSAVSSLAAATVLRSGHLTADVLSRNSATVRSSDAPGTAASRDSRFRRARCSAALARARSADGCSGSSFSALLASERVTGQSLDALARVIPATTMFNRRRCKSPRHSSTQSLNADEARGEYPGRIDRSRSASLAGSSVLS